ncbi:DUF4401 domain-containing protein [Corallococcus exiguus]|uniref:DUF4401 domain-containing protein n=1 Tax=Corallococcus exiguus TaxID=83462 RepID=UPI0014714358|nr:DUF4401 domain-containing protein [Corallococcus exiguus]NNB88643.1 DUF4401 domain-containing protein [Corallococcus exiguus]NNB97857.1 DUF4401 domain-containing protein [Corallococcus exiguus]NNC07895.1 DUF4401 domain-containing protein [Corallococcus exiguus]
MALRPTIQDVLAGLKAEGHVDAEVDARARTVLEIRQKTLGASPWFVKALAGGGAWLSAAFMLSFFACVGLWKEEVALTGLGLMLAVASVFLRRSTQGPFMEQLALALCMAGVGAFLLGLGQMDQSTPTIAFAGAVASLALLAVFPDLILYFLATVGLCVSVGVLALDTVSGAGVDVWMLLCAAALSGILLFEPLLRRGQLGPRVGPIAFALACAVPGWLLFRSFESSQEGFRYVFRFESAFVPSAYLSILLALLVGWTGWRVLRELGLSQEQRVWIPAAGALVLLTVMTLNTPGVLVAVLMLTLGFHRRSRVMLGLAVAFLLTFGAYYYYDLRITLLAKALALTGSGLVLLGVRQFFLRRQPAVLTEAR